MRIQPINVTVDIVVFLKDKAETFVLLIKRKNPPFQNQWALPGGFVDENETLQTASLRELKEETGIELSSCKQLFAFGKPGRDPWGHIISIAHVGFVESRISLKANDDAKNANWFELNQLPELAFDHREIIDTAVYRFLQDRF